jgi:hypothetical protein
MHRFTAGVLPVNLRRVQFRPTIGPTGGALINMRIPLELNRRSRIFLLGAAGEQEENGLGASASGPARTLAAVGEDGWPVGQSTRGITGCCWPRAI